MVRLEGLGAYAFAELRLRSAIRPLPAGPFRLTAFSSHKVGADSIRIPTCTFFFKCWCAWRDSNPPLTEFRKLPLYPNELQAHSMKFFNCYSASSAVVMLLRLQQTFAVVMLLRLQQTFAVVMLLRLQQTFAVVMLLRLQQTFAVALVANALVANALVAEATPRNYILNSPRSIVDSP